MTRKHLISTKSYVNMLYSQGFAELISIYNQVSVKTLLPQGGISSSTILASVVVIFKHSGLCFTFYDIRHSYDDAKISY